MAAIDEFGEASRTIKPANSKGDKTIRLHIQQFFIQSSGNFDDRHALPDQTAE